jgi:hypothetical protein
MNVEEKAHFMDNYVKPYVDQKIAEAIAKLKSPPESMTKKEPEPETATKPVGKKK